MIQEIEMSEKEHSRWKKDPSFITLVQVFLLVEVVLLILKDYVYLGEHFWITVIILGFGLTVLYVAVIRDLRKKHRRSTFTRIILGTALVCLGCGLIFGFRKLFPHYISIFVSLVLYYLFHKKQMKQE
jgi:hypothetical protein